MKKFIPALFGLLLFSGCVKKRLFVTERTNRQLSEAREKVLSAELSGRKSEAEKMVATIGGLNKTIGKQEGDIAELRAHIVQLGNNANKTSTMLSEEKMQLEKQLQEITSQLAQSNTELTRLKQLITKRNTTLDDLQKTVDAAYKDIPDVKTMNTGEAIVLVLPDKNLFEPAGLNIPVTGKTLITPLAQLLSERPGLNVDIAAYTDNQLPKGNKTLTDTWDWSLRRATAITRLLITDFSINANQLTPVGKGEFYPVTTNETPEGRAQNRRTEFVLKPRITPVK